MRLIRRHNHQRKRLLGAKDSPILSFYFILLFLRIPHLRPILCYFYLIFFSFQYCFFSRKSFLKNTRRPREFCLTLLVISSYTKIDISWLITSISEAWKRHSLFIVSPQDSLRTMFKIGALQVHGVLDMEPPSKIIFSRLIFQNYLFSSCFINIVCTKPLLFCDAP